MSNANTLEEDQRASFAACIFDEDPKLTNGKAVIAYEYFKHGWDAAVARYTNQVKATYKKYTLEDFTQTNLQKAVIMGTSGTPQQQQEAREFLRAFLNRY